MPLAHMSERHNDWGLCFLEDGEGMLKDHVRGHRG